MFGDPIFSNVKIPDGTEVIFVADLFVEDYVGGAELTTQALIDSCPFQHIKIKSKDITLKHLELGKDCFWIFGNFASLNPELIPSIVGNLKYSVLEYDYKFCKFRSPEKHEMATGAPCDCHENISGKLISAFYFGAKALFWMSESQKHIYTSKFPFLLEKPNIVLSSVFDHKTLGLLKMLRENVQTEEKSGWIVLGSNSWIKGFEAAKKWCEDNHKQYEVVWNVPYEQLLAKLAGAQGFVYLPLGNDTCPRMVIEAKLLGCELHINENVQHSKEEWFDTDDLESISEYLYGAHTMFWNAIKSSMFHSSNISGYITTYNCQKQGYPFVESIISMLEFCKEVCVVDGGSTDGTWETLQKLSNDHLDHETQISKIKIKQVTRDWSHPRHAVFDGMQKSEARKMCTGDFCWQMDSDEIVHELDAPKIASLCDKFPAGVDILSLPVIEYWGGPEKIRADIQPWKWRLSKNKINITHGIPKDLRINDQDGNLCALGGTDGCDMIDVETGERLPHATFHSENSERLRQAAMSNVPGALEQYGAWFNQVIQNIPGVYHYSWYDIPRKMRLYRDYWTRHWNSLYNKSLEDTAETNMMFDMPWSQVTDDMIDAKAQELKMGTGGWIWHRKWNGENVPHITINMKEPVYVSKVNS